MISSCGQQARRLGQSRQRSDPIGFRNRLARTSWIAIASLALLAARAAPQAAPESDLERALAIEIDRFVEADRAAPPAACQVLFVGSSSIVKWKDSLAADMAPIPVINRGFGSSHIEYVNRWFDEIVAPYRPRAIVFYAGENDLDAGKSVDRVVADFDEFMARKTRALGDTPVYFISLKPSKSRFAQLALQSRVNEQIEARAGRRSDLHYLDVATPMLESGKPKDLFVADGLHMNREGYAIWTRVVRAALQPNAEAQERSCRRANPQP
jgi:lysophospholipase L1-like esterase